MDKLKFGRRPLRAKLTKAMNEAEALLLASPVDKLMLRCKLKMLQDTYSKLQEFDSQIQDKMIEDGIAEDEVDKEYDETTAYQEKFILMSTRIEEIFVVVPRVPSPTPSLSSASATGCTERKGIKLPQIQLGKFNGELKEWLGFWSQFQKIHEDPELDGSDKFQYLQQYMVPGTTPHKIVTSYPQTRENYPKAVEALKAKYGDEDMLLQVYVRELLKLVISNVNAKNKISLESLVLQLDSHLRSLDTLNIQNADPATWLFPLVESSLPEETLTTWQRNSLSQLDGSMEDPPKTRLDYVMMFLTREVAIRERIKLAQSGFQGEPSKKMDKNTKMIRHQLLPVSTSVMRPLVYFVRRAIPVKNALLE